MQPVPFTTVSAGEIPRPSTPDLETARCGSDRFNREVVAHLNSLYRFALRKTRNQQEAEDLVQDTLLRALEFQHRLQPGSNCRAWLFTIMHNLFVNRIRKSSLSLVDFDEKQAHRERALGAWLPDNPEEYLFYRLAAEDIQRAVQTLSPKFRAAVVLADIEGRSYREIAEICRCPIGTVMSRLHRGRHSLRATLREYGNGRPGGAERSTGPPAGGPAPQTRFARTHTTAARG